MSGTTPPFKRYTTRGPASRTSAGDQNRLRDTAERLDKPYADPNAGVRISRTGGGMIYEDAEGVKDRFLIQITGGASSPYTSWTEVVDDGSGGFTAPANAMTGGGVTNAREINGAVVPTNSLGLAWLADDNLSVDFIFAGASTSFTAPVTVTDNALGTSTATGVNITNTTAAAAGAQQVSPALVLTGQGWETNTSASQSVQFQEYVVPVQGAASPTGVLHFQVSVNGAAYADVMTVDNSGNLAATGNITVTGQFIGSGAGLTNLPGADTSSNPTGTTTASLANVFDITNAKGLHGSFTLKNTSGSFTLQYQITTTDLFGAVTTGSLTTLSPNSEAGFVLDSVGALAGAGSNPPFKEVKLQVQNGSGAATWSCWLSTVG